MTYEEALQDALAHFDGIAERSMGNLTKLLLEHSATAAEAQREIELHRIELAQERERVAQEFHKQMGDWDGFDRDGEPPQCSRVK